MAHKGSFREMLPELFILFNILTRYGLIVKEKAWCFGCLRRFGGEGVHAKAQKRGGDGRGKRFTQRRGGAKARRTQSGI